MAGTALGRHRGPSTRLPTAEFHEKAEPSPGPRAHARGRARDPSRSPQAPCAALRRDPGRVLAEPGRGGRCRGTAGAAGAAGAGKRGVDFTDLAPVIPRTVVQRQFPGEFLPLQSGSRGAGLGVTGLRGSADKRETLLMRDVPMAGGDSRRMMMEAWGFLLELGTVPAPAFCWDEGIRDPSQDGVMGSETHPGMEKRGWDTPGWPRTSGNLQRQSPAWPCRMELGPDDL